MLSSVTRYCFSPLKIFDDALRNEPLCAWMNSCSRTASPVVKNLNKTIPWSLPILTSLRGSAVVWCWWPHLKLFLGFFSWWRVCIFPLITDQNEEEGGGYLALWILHEDSCWWRLDVQVRKGGSSHQHLFLHSWGITQLLFIIILIYWPLSRAPRS